MKVDCKKGDNSSVALLNTRSLEKRNNICAERGRNDATKQIDHPSAMLQLEGEQSYKYFLCYRKLVLVYHYITYY